MEFLSQANLQTKTQPNLLIDGFFGLTWPSQPKDALHNKNTIAGYGKKCPKSQNKKETREKKPSDRKFDFRDV